MAGPGSEEIAPGGGGFAEFQQRSRLEMEKHQALRNSGREGGSFEEALSTASDSFTPLRIERAIMRRFEKMDNHPSSSDKYDLKYCKKAIEVRIEGLALSPNDLLNRGIVSEIEPDGTTSKIKESLYALTFVEQTMMRPSSYEKVPQGAKPEPDDLVIDGQAYRASKTYKPETVRKPRIGTAEERERVHDTFVHVGEEMLTRQLLHEQYSFYHQNIDNLDGLVSMYFGELPFSTAISDGKNEGFFNMPEEVGVDSVILTGAEVRGHHEFGDKVDLAIRLYKIIGLSEKPEELLKHITDPWFKEILFPDKTKENLGKSSEELIKMLIGQPDKWEKGIQFKKTNDQEVKYYRPKSVRDPETGKKISLIDLEYKKGLRGELTKYGNVFAHYDYKAELALKELFAKILGNNQSAKDAVELAFRWTKVTGRASNLGYEEYFTRAYREDPKKSFKTETYGLEVMGAQRKGQTEVERNISLDMDMGPATDDFAKLIHPERFFWKYMTTHRDSALFALRRNCEPFITEFFNAVSIENTSSMGIPKPSQEGLTSERSIVELMEGHGKKGDPDYERPLRLGEIDFQLTREMIFNKYYNYGFMAMKKDVGSFVLTQNTEVRFDDLVNPTYWSRFNKNIGVGVNKGCVVNGNFRGKVADTITDATEARWQNMVLQHLKGVMSMPLYASWAEANIKVPGYIPTGTRNDIALRAIIKKELGIDIDTTVPKDTKNFFQTYSK